MRTLSGKKFQKKTPSKEGVKDKEVAESEAETDAVTRLSDGSDTSTE